MDKKTIYFKDIESKFLNTILVICSIIAVLLIVLLMAIVCLPIVAIPIGLGTISVVIALIGILILMPVGIIINKKKRK